MKQSTDRLTELGGEGAKRKLNKGRGEWATQTSFVQSMTAGQTRHQMKLDSREWDHSCNTGNVIANGIYLREVDTSSIDGIQGRHIAEYSEQRQPNGGMLTNCFLWGGV